MSRLIGWKECKKDNIVIYGSGAVGEVLDAVLELEGCRCVCFCDNNTQRIGSKLRGKKIYSPETVLEKYADPVFILAVNNIQYAVRQLSFGEGVQIVDSTSLLEYYLQKSVGIFIEQEKNRGILRYMVQTCMFSLRNYPQDRRKLTIRSLQLMITERCSLRCKDCTNLVQYYKNPKDSDFEATLASIDRLSCTFDEINDIHIIGGEPFVCKHFHEYVKRILEKENLKNIIIFTNATVVPADEQLRVLQSERVIVTISDYGKYSRNLDALVEKLRQLGINYRIYRDLRWNEHSKVWKRNRTEKELEENLLKCTAAANCTSIAAGKLFRCYYADHVYQLKAVPYEANEYLDLLKEETTKDEIYEFLYQKKRFAVCDWCSGGDFKAASLEPALQAINPLSYKEYGGYPDADS